MDLALQAASLIRPGDTVFLDASPTARLVAHELAERAWPVVVISNGLWVMSAIAEHVNERPRLVSLGGHLSAAGAFLGPNAIGALQAQFADWAVLSVPAITPDGVLVDSDHAHAEVKRLMFAHAERRLVAIDGGGGKHPIGRAEDALVLAPATMGANEPIRATPAARRRAT